MTFDEQSGQFVCEKNGLVFDWDDEPEENVEDVIKMLSENYESHLDSIIDFMLPDIEEIYGSVDSAYVKEHLGRPHIDYDNGTVVYPEQTFDDTHIFTFEFLDDKFEELQYFSIDG